MVQINGIDQDIVFTAEEPGSRGASRLSYDLAHGIAAQLGVEPVILAEWHAKAIMANPAYNTLVICINRENELALRNTPDERMLTVGISGFHSYEEILKNDIILNPSFNPTRFPKKWSPREGQVVINYTYTPSRMKPSPEPGTAGAFTASAAAQVPDLYSGVSRTVAVYVRSPRYGTLKKLMRMMRHLGKKYGYRFLVSSGPDTAFNYRNTEIPLQECVRSMPNSEFNCYSAHRLAENAATLERYFAEADAIIVTPDTVSTLSDAANTGLPVFLLTHSFFDQMDVRNLPDPRNRALQNELFKQNRLMPFTISNIRSAWRPDFHDDWQQINSQIARIARERLQRLKQLPASQKVA